MTVEQRLEAIRKQLLAARADSMDAIDAIAKSVEELSGEIRTQASPANGITPGLWVIHGDSLIVGGLGSKVTPAVCLRPSEATPHGHEVWIANARAIIAWRKMHDAVGRLLALTGGWPDTPTGDVIAELRHLHAQAEGGQP